MKRAEVLSKLSAVTRNPRTESIIWYGNHEGEDVNLLVIMQGDEYQAARWGEKQELDVVIIGEQRFSYMASCLDPIATEAILRGEEIYGEKQACYRKMLSFARPVPVAINYLMGSADFFINDARILLKGEETRDVLITLSFAVSYILFVCHYVRSRKIISFAEILSKPNSVLLEKIRERMKDPRHITKQEALSFFNLVKRFLARQIDIMEKDQT